MEMMVPFKQVESSGEEGVGKGVLGIMSEVHVVGEGLCTRESGGQRRGKSWR